MSLLVPVVEKSHSHFCTRVKLFSVLSWIHISCGVTILDWRIQCWVCVSARLLPKCPWHQNREEEDRWDSLPGGPPTDRAPCCARCLHQSVTQHHKSLPQHLIVLCHPQCVTCAVWVCRSHDGLSNWLHLTQCAFSFLIKPHQKWHPSLTRNRLPAETHHSVSQACFLSVWQPLRVSGLCHV